MNDGILRGTIGPRAALRYKPGDVVILPSGVSPRGRGWISSGQTITTQMLPALRDISASSLLWVTAQSTTLTGFTRGIEYGNGSFVVVSGSGRIAYSADGDIWTTSTSNTTVSFSCVAYGNGTWVAAGSSTIMADTTTGVGATWATVTSNFGTSTISTIAYGGGIFVAAGSGGTLRTSTDGVTWVTQVSNFGTTAISYVAYGNGVWVAVGSRIIKTSTDGVTWATVPLVTNAGVNINAVAYGQGKFVASGSTWTLTSRNGTTWTTSDSRISWSGATASHVVYGGGRWISTPANTIRTSSDGLTWYGNSTSSTVNPTGRPAYGGGIWLVGSSSGVIFRAGPVKSTMVGKPFPAISAPLGYTAWLKT